MSAIKTLLLYFAFILIALFQIPKHAQAQSTVVINNEYKLKAAYTYNFIKYISWPTMVPTDTFYIGVLGKSDIFKILSTIAKNRIAPDGRPIVVYQYSRPQDFNMDGKNAPQLQRCQILFVSKNADQYLDRKQIQQLSQNNILMIGEKDGFTCKGGHINFVAQRNKLRFTIHQNNAIDCGFKINPKLLKVAILGSDEECKKRNKGKR